jgi:hypothetical protein
MPMMIQSLYVDDPGLLVSTLDAFVTLTKAAPGIAAEHVSSLLPRALSVAQSHADAVRATFFFFFPFSFYC